MKITTERNLDVEELFDTLVDNFADYYVCEEAKLTDDDFTPDVLADIFSELADIAARRAAEAAKAKRE